MVTRITNTAFEILSFYRADYTASLHVRAMAKILGTSHVALLPHLRLLEELKILNAHTSGRNKQFTLNKDNILAKYLMSVTEELATIDFLEKNFLLKKLAENMNTIDLSISVLLFGSYVKGYANEESDIDLFTIGRLTENQQNAFSKFEATFGKKISIKTATTENFSVGLRNGDILIREVVANHIVIRNADPFVTLLWRQYVER